MPLQYALQSRRGHCSVLLETLKGFIQITFAVGLRVDAELIPLFPPPLQPTHEFLLALFNHVREKDLSGLVPELMQLTFKVS